LAHLFVQRKLLTIEENNQEDLTFPQTKFI